jgi:hypothetical protein
MSKLLLVYNNSFALRQVKTGVLYVAAIISMQFPSML